MRAALAGVLASLVVAAPAAASAGDLTVTRRAQLGPRLVELGFTTPALPEETNVRVLLPDGYDAQPDRRWPVLYLLHGCCDYDVDGSQAWTTHGEVEAATKGLPLIVVMPAGGKGGMYSDWQSAGTRGRPQWETYHLDQLMPWVDANFRTRASRTGRAIAGLSMGGFGAMKYASTYPDRFVFAASFSGIPDSNTDDGRTHAALPGLDGGTPASVWGPRATSELRWRSQNPWDLAENLAPLRIELRTGNGQRGPLDEGFGPPSDGVEATARRNTVSFHERLGALGIGHLFDDYGPGTHSWPYWARDLRASLPSIADAFAHPPAAPARITYRSAEPAYAAYGWDVAFERAGLAWSRLVRAGRRGFTLEGSGTVVVRTPAFFPKRRLVRVDDGRRRYRLRADGAGRLAIRLSPVTRATVRLALWDSQRQRPARVRRTTPRT